MDILASKLRTLEHNIINAQILFTNQKISSTLKRFYSNQINLSKKIIIKTHLKFKISQSLAKLSKNCYSDSQISHYYIRKNISSSFRIFKNNLHNQLVINIIYKLNMLEKIIYVKKDLIFGRIKNTVIYREKKDRTIRKIDTVFTELSEKTAVDYERCLKLLYNGKDETKTCKIEEEAPTNPFLCAIKQAGGSRSRQPRYSTSLSLSNRRPLKRKKSSLESQIDIISSDKLVNEPNTREHAVDAQRYANNSNDTHAQTNEQQAKTNKQQAKNGTCEINCRKPEISYNDILCTVQKISNTKNKEVAGEENKVSQDHKSPELAETKTNRFPIENWHTAFCEINRGHNNNENFCIALQQNISDKIKQNEGELTRNLRLVALNNAIQYSLHKHTNRLVDLMQESYVNLYYDLVNLKILISFEKLNYFVKGQKIDNSKLLAYEKKLRILLHKGNLDSDRRFLHMIDDTLVDIEKYKDPVVVRMGIQFILAKKYVQDLIYLKE